MRQTQGLVFKSVIWFDHHKQPVIIDYTLCTDEETEAGEVK